MNVEGALAWCYGFVAAMSIYHVCMQLISFPYTRTYIYDTCILIFLYTIVYNNVY